ncbi:MAG: sensor domain-containing diguanylate cyclase [Gammaproteobacteria bacterium]|nr:sensor domain-containing diguanylate cyclase [Gammaproteobacteria bacterium]
MDKPSLEASFPLLQSRRDVQARERIDELLKTARHNEQLQKRFQDMELKILAIESMSDLNAFLQDDFKKTFRLDDVVLLLNDPRHEVMDALGVCDNESDCSGLVCCADQGILARLATFGGAPVLTPFDERRHQWVFADKQVDGGSLAFLPLRRQEGVIGCMVFYSRNADRYKSGAATEFLQRLASITAVCIENALNRERLRRLSLTDALTGLANRREFDKRIIEEISRSRREKLPLSCLYLDVDFFKKVNDNYGHDVGDVVLQKVSACMLEAVRKGDIVARLGGEEFVVLLPGINEALAMETAERIRVSVGESRLEVNVGEFLSVTISIGLASFKPVEHKHKTDDEIAADLLKLSDHALLEAKETGRNKVVISD